MHYELSKTPPKREALHDLLNTVKPRFRFAVTGGFQAWAESLIPAGTWTGDVHYLSVSENGQLAGIVPLGIQRVYGMRFLSLGGDFFPIRAMPIDAQRCEQVCAKIADALTEIPVGVGLRFGPVEESDEAVTAMFGALRERGWSVRTNKIGTELVTSDLPKSFEEFRVTLGKKLRKHTPYYERKLYKEHDTEIRHYNNESVDTWVQVIKDLGQIEERSWLVDQGVDGDLKYVAPGQLSYWRQWLANPLASANTNVWVIYCDNTPVSFAFTLDSGDTRYMLANSYDKAFRDYSTGSILYWHAFADAIGKGIRRINAGIGNSGYKKAWKAEPTESVLDWVAFRPGIRGRLLALLSRLRS